MQQRAAATGCRPCFRRWLMKSTPGWSACSAAAASRSCCCTLATWQQSWAHPGSVQCLAAGTASRSEASASDAAAGAEAKAAAVGGVAAADAAGAGALVAAAAAPGGAAEALAIVTAVPVVAAGAAAVVPVQALVLALPTWPCCGGTPCGRSSGSACGCCGSGARCSCRNWRADCRIVTLLKYQEFAGWGQVGCCI